MSELMEDAMSPPSPNQLWQQHKRDDAMESVVSEFSVSVELTLGWGRSGSISSFHITPKSWTM